MFKLPTKKLTKENIKKSLKTNRLLLLSFIFFFAFSFITHVFATSLPYTSTDAILDPTCGPTDTNCTVTPISIGATVGNSSTAGSVLYVDGTNKLGQDNSNLFYDATNHRLGIGTTNPQFGVDVASAGFTASIDAAEFDGDVDSGDIDDMTTSGTYTGTEDDSYFVYIPSTGTPDQFVWCEDDDSFCSDNTDITGSPQLLRDGVYVTFANTTGHTGNEFWAFETHYAATPGIINTSDAYYLGGEQFASQNSDTSSVSVGDGAGSPVNGNNNSFFGIGSGGSIENGDNNSIFGYNAGSAMTNGSSNTILGTQSGASVDNGSYNVLLGYGSDINGGSISSSIGIGTGALVDSNNQLVIGGNVSQNGSINQAYLGSGIVDPAANNLTLQLTGASGLDEVGNTFTLAGSKGTGAGIPGSLLFDTSTATSSGSNLQDLSERMRIDGATGNVGIGTSSPITPLEVAASDKLSAWTLQTSPENIEWTSIAYGNGTFVALSPDFGGSQQVMTSPDGVTWTAQTAAEGDNWNSVTFGNGIFVAVSSFAGGSHKVMTSPDGVTWTQRNASANSSWEGVAFGNNTFVAVAFNEHGVMTSSDGITWADVDPPEHNKWQRIAYGNGTFVAVDCGCRGGSPPSHEVMTSPDGTTWTMQTAAESHGWSAIAYGGGIFVALTGDNASHQVMTSPDGVTWTARTAAENNAWDAITYGNGLFVAVAEGGTHQIMTSSDGINWIPSTAAEDASWDAIAYGGGTFAAVGDGGTIMTSSLIASPGSYVSYMANTDTDASNGVLQLGLGNTTANTPTSNIFLQLLRGSTATSVGTAIGSISGNGSGGVAYNTTSDARLKENIVPTTSGLDDLMKIEVKNFNFIGSDVTVQGFIAQNLETVYPYAVATNGDNGTDPLTPGENPWMVDYGRVTPLLVQSIQDLNLKLTGIDSLDLTNSNSVGSLITSFLENASNGITDLYAGVMHSDKVETKELCVGNTCVTESQFLQMVNSSNVTPAPSAPESTPPAPDPTPSPSSTPDPTVTPPDSSTPAPTPNPTVTPAPDPAPDPTPPSDPTPTPDPSPAPSDSGQ